MLVAKLVPEVMEGFVMGTEDYVAESGSISRMAARIAGITLLV